MGLLSRINEAIEEAAREQQAQAQAAKRGQAGKKESGYSQPRRLSPPVKKPDIGYWGSKARAVQSAVVVGYPVVWPGINWNDVGLGLVRTMGFVPNKAVKIEFKDRLCELTGARAHSFVIYFLAAGGFGLIYFLQDLLSYIENWGWFLSSAIVIVPLLVNLFVRNRTLRFMSYEIEMLAYDSENGIMILSTLTQPGGVVALKLDLPQDKKMRVIEEKRILTDLRKVYSGLSNIDGLATIDNDRFKQTIVWWLVWLMLFGLARYFQ